ncbi:EamA family transporter [Candidatus Soleaferrea massiliensis]|uniref:EamA family transporter n=1 Tax=Candidatus Soleaferrea massiliensis TaxID=1470354 RepID=UPI00058EDD28|nr:EamA family transporter [Candidatus Soleaferrea massiliensis]
MNVISYIGYLFAEFISAVANLILKTSANKKPRSFLKKFLNVRVISSYGVFVIANLINVLALKHMELKFVPALQATGFIWILILSAVFLKEKPTRKKLIGNALILIGLVIFCLY